MLTVTLARHAMATRFELVLHGSNATPLRAAGEEALDEVERLEEQLSIYRESSQLAAVNAHAAQRPVRVSPEVFALLQRAKALYENTDGAFDVAVAPLVKCWGFMGGGGRRPAPETLLAARACAGMHLVDLDETSGTVRFRRPGVMLDLGAVGKGYAIDRAVLILREAGVESALVHGGTSTVYGLGSPPDREAWRVAIDRPPIPGTASASGDEPILAEVTLRNEALSVSGIHGKCFQEKGKTMGHILDPRTGEPAAAALLAAVISPSATDSDALSTALLVSGSEAPSWVVSSDPPLRTLIATANAAGLQVRTRGIRFPG